MSLVSNLLQAGPVVYSHLALLRLPASSSNRQDMMYSVYKSGRPALRKVMEMVFDQNPEIEVSVFILIQV